MQDENESISRSVEAQVPFYGEICMELRLARKRYASAQVTLTPKAGALRSQELNVKAATPSSPKRAVLVSNLVVYFQAATMPAREICEIVEHEEVTATLPAKRTTTSPRQKPRTKCET